MNEEEKQAIDWLKEELDDEKKSCKNRNYSYKGVTGLYGNNEVEIALKLIEKQQKEIKARLEEIDSLYKMMSAKDDEIETLKESQLVLYGQKGEIVGVLKYADDVISKDKIKEKIEEITSYAYTSAEERDCQDYAIQVLKELLGE